MLAFGAKAVAAEAAAPEIVLLRVAARLVETRLVIPIVEEVHVVEELLQRSHALFGIRVRLQRDVVRMLERARRRDACAEVASAETVRGDEIDVRVGVVAHRFRRAGREPGIGRRPRAGGGKGVLKRDVGRRNVQWRLESVGDAGRMWRATAPLRTGKGLV